MPKHPLRLAALAIVAGATLAACAGGAPSAQPQTTVVPGAVIADDRVVAEARVVPVRSAALALADGGIAREVLVAEGDTVQADQVLVHLDRRLAAAGLAQAEAELARAEAALARLRAGATTAELAVAEAQVARAQAQLEQTQGGVTSSDITAAEARLAQARARLAEVERGSARQDAAQALARLEQQRALLQSERSRLSATKTDAELRLSQAVDTLTKAQSAFATAKQNWEFVRDTGADPTNPEVRDASGKEVRNRLNDVQRQQYYDAFVAAEATLRTAEASVEQAKVAFNAARDAEATGVTAAEQRVGEAQAAYEAAAANSDADEIADARAAVADAQAQLDRLRGGERAGTLAVAEAQLAEAQANLQRLQQGPTKEEVAEAEAQVEAAQAQIESAQAQIAQLELRAPFSGIVAAVDVRPGEYVNVGTAVVNIGDTTEWQIETTDLTELSIVRVQPDAPVSVTFDALPGVEMTGKVVRIRELGENRQGDITYRVIVALDEQDARLRWNMTASVAIATE